MRFFVDGGWSPDRAVVVPDKGCGDNTPQHVEAAFLAGYDALYHVKRCANSPDAVELFGGLQHLRRILHLLQIHHERAALFWLHEDDLGNDIAALAADYGVLDRLAVTGNSVPDAVQIHQNTVLAQVKRSSEYEQARAPGTGAFLDPFGVERETPFRWLKGVEAFAKNHKSRGNAVYVASPDWRAPKIWAGWNQEALIYDVSRLPIFGIITADPAIWQKPQEPA